MASEANTVSGAGADQGTLDMRNPGQGKHDQLPCVQSAPDQVKQWYGCYGARGDLFTQESNRHPAKMAVQLCYRIFEHGQRRGYWKPGDTILDPMGGIGTTGIVGASLGYNVLLLELEHHFLSLAAANVCVLQTKIGPPYFVCGQCGFRVSRWNRPMDKPHLCQGCGLYDLPIEAGKISLLQGDARQLEAVLSQADAAPTSPPYSSEFREQHPGTRGGAIAQESQRGRSFRGYGAAVSSPPYTDQQVGGPIASWVLKVAREQGIEEAVRRYRKEVIERLPKHGRWSDANTRKHIESALRQWNAGTYAGVVSSPIYGDSGLQVGCSHVVRKLGAEEKWDEAITLFRQFEEEQVRQGMRRSVRSDAAIRALIQRSLESEKAGYSGGARAPDDTVSSPPFLQASAGGGIADKGYGDGSDKVGERTYSRKTARTSPAQIGNLPDPKGDIERVLNIEHFAELADDKETYLSATRKVYAQLRLVLRLGGVVCLVTKNPVKKGQIRRLDSDTIRLMQACGFTFLERQVAMLAEELGVQQRLDGGADNIRREHKSFFKRLFERKYPDLRIDHEDVLWFRKA